MLSDEMFQDENGEFYEISIIFNAGFISISFVEIRYV